MVGSIRKLLMTLIGGCIILTSGCASPVDHKSPEEILSLTVSGLSGIDHYGFSGQTDILLGDRVKLSSTSFQGTVKEHDQIQVKSSEQGNRTLLGNPLELLKQVQLTAQKTELVQQQSGHWTSVLSITSNKEASTRLWTTTLRDEFAKIEKKVPAALSKGHVIRIKSANTQSQEALLQEWKAELQRSKAEFDKMLSTLQVESTYNLIVDRKHLIPLRLKETAILHYKTVDGQQQKETRTTDMTFLMTGSKGR